MSGQAFIFTCYPPPGRPIRTPSGLVVHLHSPSTAVKAFPDRERSESFIFTRYPSFPDRERSSRSSSLAIRRQEGAPGPRMAQPFIFIALTATRQAYPDPKWSILHSPSGAGRAFSSREWSSRLSPLDIRHQEGVSGPRVVQAFIFTRYPPPGRRIRTRSGLAVHLHSPIRRWEGVFGPRMVQPFYPQSISATRKAYPEPEGSRR